MSSIKLTAPKRRRGQRLTSDPPHPVPTIATNGTLPTVDDWNYYTGTLVDDHVLVRHSGDMDLLYRMGFFGKGNLSRNKPEYNEGFWSFRKRRNQGNNEGPLLRVVSKRQYLSHQSWKDQQKIPGQLPDAVSAAERISKVKVKTKPFSHKSHERLPAPDPASRRPDAAAVSDTQGDPDVSSEDMQGSSEGRVQAMDQSEERLQMDARCPSAPMELSDWPSPRREEEPEEEDLWAVDANDKASADFWAVDTKVGDAGATKDSSDFLGIAQPKANLETSPKTQSTQNDSPEMTDRSSTDKRNSADIDRHQVSIADTALGQTPEADTDHTNKVNADSADSTVTTSKGDCQSQPSSSVPLGDSDIKAQTSETNVQHSQVDPEEKPEVPPEVGEALPVPVNLDPLCREEDAGGTLYVVEDSDGEEAEGAGEGTCQEGKGKDLVWIPTQKLDPYPLHECLQLTFEEAFFLSYGLGCLVVINERQEPMGLTQLWQIFSARRKNFITNYIAYHSLRSRGWVPKSGIKYGTDFIVYHKGPAFFHGSYSVLVRTAHEPGLRDDLDQSNPTLTWATLMGSDRVTETVAKDPLLLLVIRPRDLTDEEMTSPNCVRRFKVQETLLRRWVPSRERESAEVPEWL